MKKYIYILAVLLFISCGNTIEEQTVEDNTRAKKQHVRMSRYWQDAKIYVITFDSCQYVVIDKYRQSGLSHKGNCNNPIHK